MVVNKYQTHSFQNVATNIHPHLNSAKQVRKSQSFCRCVVQRVITSRTNYSEKCKNSAILFYEKKTFVRTCLEFSISASLAIMLTCFKRRVRIEITILQMTHNGDTGLHSVNIQIESILNEMETENYSFRQAASSFHPCIEASLVS